MAVDLWLVRHGQAAFATDDYDRLTPLGAQQAEWLGDHLRDQGTGFDCIAHGALRRQRETAEAIARILGATAVLQPGLEEYSADALIRAAGFDPDDRTLTRRQHFARLRGILVDWSEGRVVGAETWAAFRDRVRGALDALTQARDGRVLAAASGGSIAMAVADVLGLSAGKMITLNLQARNTGVTRLVFSRSGVYLNQFNAVPHLERADRQYAETYS